MISLPTAFIPRKCLEPGGISYILNHGRVSPAPPDVAGYHIIRGKRVPLTWRELHDIRRKHQAERLERIRHPEQPDWRPVLVWVFYNPGWLFCGWWCYLRTFRDRPLSGHHIGGYGPKGNITGRSQLAMSLMRQIPLGILPDPANFEDWMIAFADAYPKPKTRRDPRRAGILSGWSDGRSFVHRDGHVATPLSLP